MINIKTTTLVLAASLATFSVTQAFAQNQNRNCGPRDAVIERLATGYGESRQSMGLGANNQVVEVFASEETGTWTITVSMANGMTCLVASGQAFRNLNEEVVPGAKGTDM